MKRILIQLKLHFILSLRRQQHRVLHCGLRCLVCGKPPDTSCSQESRHPAIPITVRQLQRHLELEERGLPLPSSPRGVWPLFSTELFAPELGPMVGSLPSVIPIWVFPYLSVDN